MNNYWKPRPHYAHEYRQVVASATLARKIIEENFGDKTFTRKEYFAIAKKSGAMAIETLSVHGFVKIVQTDTFEIEVKPYDFDTWAVDQNSNPMMKWWEYSRLPEVAKKAMAVMNGGKELEKKETYKTTVEANRFHYAPDWEKLDEYATKVKPIILEDSKEKLAKAQKQVALHQAVLDCFNSLL